MSASAFGRQNFAMMERSRQLPRNVTPERNVGISRRRMVASSELKTVQLGVSQIEPQFDCARYLAHCLMP